MNTPSSTDPIHFESALERTGGDREFLDELIGLYFEDFDDKMPQLKKAVEEKDAGLIRELAHGLKGSSANLSLLPLQDLFYRLEMTGRDNNPAEAEKLLPPLLQEYEKLRKFLKKQDVDETQEASDPGENNGAPSDRNEADDSSRKRKILLADDSDDNQLIIQRYLSGSWYGLDLAKTGEYALDLFSNHSYDVVFLDLNMPGMNGLETLERIREIEKENGLSHTPVICLSATSDQEEIERCLSRGFDGFVEKPVEKVQLLGTIEKYAGIGKDVPQAEKISIDDSILDLIPGYLANRKKDAAAMKFALDKSDFDTIESLAHKMKGSGASYGFDPISELGKQIEQSAKEKKQDSIRSGINDLEAFLENAKYE